MQLLLRTPCNQLATHALCTAHTSTLVTEDLTLTGRGQVRKDLLRCFDSLRQMLVLVDLGGRSFDLCEVGCRLLVRRHNRGVVRGVGRVACLPDHVACTALLRQIVLALMLFLNDSPCLLVTR